MIKNKTLQEAYLAQPTSPPPKTLRTPQLQLAIQPPSRYSSTSTMSFATSNNYSALSDVQSLYNSRTNKSLMTKNKGMKITPSSTPEFNVFYKDALIENSTNDVALLHTSHTLPTSSFPAMKYEFKKEYAVPISAPSVISTSPSLDVGVHFDSPQPEPYLLITTGVNAETRGEPFEFTPSVSSAVSAPPNPVPFIQELRPRRLPTMILETWNDEFLPITLPSLSWVNTEPYMDALWAQHLTRVQIEKPAWFG
jgi:hypothetical protein